MSSNLIARSILSIIDNLDYYIDRFEPFAENASGFFVFFFWFNEQKTEMVVSKPYELFLGDWVLETKLCDFEQGEVPLSATYHIHDEGADLIFDMSWTDAENETHQMTLRGQPNGELAPFNGGDLVDALSITVVSRHELNTAAAMKGVVLMSVIRRLFPDAQQMAVMQEVKLPTGEISTNKSIYLRK